MLYVAGTRLVVVIQEPRFEPLFEAIRGVAKCRTTSIQMIRKDHHIFLVSLYSVKPNKK